jgi:hypothetical protein
VRLFFLASDNPQPSGGLMFIYRICEMAAALGYDAAVMHGEPGFRVTAFEHDARVVHNIAWKKTSRRARLRNRVKEALTRARSGDGSAEVRDEDIIVIPENRIPRLNEIFPRCRKIVISQNPFLALRNLPPEETGGLIGSINMSKASRRSMEALFPRKPAFDVPLWIDRAQFYPAKGRARRIAYMPRRNAEDARIVLNLLKARGALDGVEVLPIEGVPQEVVAQRLRESLMFLSFADREGFGLPGAEAIACGCITVGYTGLGGDEFFATFGGHVVPQQDVFAFADAVEDALTANDADPAGTALRQETQARAILDTYDVTRAREALRAALAALVGPGNG